MTDFKKRFSKKREELSNINSQDWGDKMPPQAVELEEAVLGAMMLESDIPDKLMGDFNTNLFYKAQHKIVAEAILDLYKAHSPIDILTVTKRIRELGKLEEVGGAHYISQLTNRIASSANVEFHLRILQQEALRRNIIQICGTGLREAYEDTKDVFDTYQTLQLGLENSLKDVLHYSVKKASVIHEQVISESIEVLKSGHRSGVTSGLRRLDSFTNGWQKSDLIILAGRPGMGKTAAAVSMVMNPAIAENIPTAIFSLEMSSSQLVGRMQSHLSGVDVSRIVKKQINKSEIDAIIRDAAVLEKAPIYIDDTPNITLIEIKGKIRKLVRENKVKLIVIDYLQLMRSGTDNYNREQEIAEISKGLKGLAKELDIPIIALSQLSRVVETRSNKKPMLSDLRESGQIEQDADLVLFCYRPEYYGIDSYEYADEIFPAEGLFILIVAKHRNGELGEIPLRFIGEQTKLTNYNFGNDSNSLTPNHSFVQQTTEVKTEVEKSKIEDNTEFLNEKNEEDNGDNSFFGTGEDDVPF